MRFLFLLLTAMCLSLLSFEAAAHAHAHLQGNAAVVAAPAAAGPDKVTEVAALPSVDEMGRVIAPGDDGLQDEDAFEEPPPVTAISGRRTCSIRLTCWTRSKSPVPCSTCRP
ncbi:hypothetical protein ACTMU2_10350 [Cupriavidus basilensis]